MGSLTTFIHLAVILFPERMRIREPFQWRRGGGQIRAVQCTNLYIGFGGLLLHVVRVHNPREALLRDVGFIVSDRNKFVSWAIRDFFHIVVF